MSRIGNGASDVKVIVSVLVSSVLDSAFGP